MQITNYFKGMTTNERFGRQANRNDSEYSETNNELLYKLKSASTAKSNLNEIAAQIKRPTSRSKKANKNHEVALNKQNTTESYDPVMAMKKLQSRDLRHQDHFRASNCVLMCRNTEIKDQAQLYTLLRRKKTDKIEH